MRMHQEEARDAEEKVRPATFLSFVVVTLTSVRNAGPSPSHSSLTTKCTTSSASRTTSSSVRATC